MRGCLRVLEHAKSIQHMNLDFGFYDPNDYPIECTQIINVVNQKAFSILKLIAKMDL